MKDRAAGLGLDVIVQDGARLPEEEEEVGGGSLPDPPQALQQLPGRPARGARPLHQQGGVGGGAGREGGG